MSNPTLATKKATTCMALSSKKATKHVEHLLAVVDILHVQCSFGIGIPLRWELGAQKLEICIDLAHQLLQGSLQDPLCKNPLLIFVFPGHPRFVARNFLPAAKNERLNRMIKQVINFGLLPCETKIKWNTKPEGPDGTHIAWRHTVLCTIGQFWVHDTAHECLCQLRFELWKFCCRRTILKSIEKMNEHPTCGVQRAAISVAQCLSQLCWHSVPIRANCFKNKLTCQGVVMQVQVGNGKPENLPRNV